MISNILSRVTWRPGIGDPNLFGWITVAAYFLAAIFCFFAAGYRADPENAEAGRETPFFWYALAFLLIGLGINKQLDLQTLFTQIGRIIAKDQGWYGTRRIYQREFIQWMIGGGLIAMALVFIWVGLKSFPHAAAFLGIIFLFCFVIVRAASFHKVDQLLKISLKGSLNLNHTLELGGIAFIALAALFYRALRRR